MIFCLYGPDSYRKNKKLNEIVGQYKSKHKDIDIKLFDLAGNPEIWGEATDFLRQPSMFVKSKLAIIKNATETERKKWIEVLKSYSKSKEVFIIISEEKKPKKEFNFLLREPVESQKFEELEGDELSRFLRQQIKGVSFKLTPGAWRFFVSYLLSDKDRSWRAVSEFQKIALAGFNSPVEESDLKKIIKWWSSEEMFLTTRKILNSLDVGVRLGYLESLIAKGEDSSHIFNLLAFQARGKDIEKFSDYDISVKSGGLEYEEALVDFAIN